MSLWREILECDRWWLWLSREVSSVPEVFGIKWSFIQWTFPDRCSVLLHFFIEALGYIHSKSAILMISWLTQTPISHRIYMIWKNVQNTEFRNNTENFYPFTPADAYFE